MKPFRRLHTMTSRGGVLHAVLPRLSFFSITPLASRKLLVLRTLAYVWLCACVWHALCDRAREIAAEAFSHILARQQNPKGPWSKAVPGTRSALACLISSEGPGTK